MSWQPEVQPDGWQPEGWQPDSSADVAVSFGSRTVFNAPIERKVWMAMSDEADFTFDPVEKDPDAERKVELNFYRWCVNAFRANEEYASGEFIRPSRPDGFSYECTTAGTTGNREPIWPATIDATIQSGSVTFTCRAASTNGLNAITSPTAESDPADITVDDVSVSESVKILAKYSTGGEDGEDYEAIFTFTLDGATRIARQLVQVRKQ